MGANISPYTTINMVGASPVPAATYSASRRPSAARPTWASDRRWAYRKSPRSVRIRLARAPPIGKITGIEVIELAGGSSNDTLLVSFGEGDHQARVENSAIRGGDLVTSDSLPDIIFSAMQAFTAASSDGGSAR